MKKKLKGWLLPLLTLGLILGGAALPYLAAIAQDYSLAGASRTASRQFSVLNLTLQQDTAATEPVYVNADSQIIKVERARDYGPNILTDVRGEYGVIYAWGEPK